MEFKLSVRPYINRPALAYELVLTRSEGSRFYDRTLCVLSGTDACDLVCAVSGVDFIEAPRSYVEGDASVIADLIRERQKEKVL